MPQIVPVLFIQAPTQALWMAVPIGLMGGIATAAYYDLAMRSCPAGLQGTLMLMVDGVYFFSQRIGDVLGTHIYNASPKYGFSCCVVAISIVYAGILPLILWVPKNIIATRDGEEILATT
ncbi:MAG TPA: hypothetical protein VG944_08315 [Fimbriimonas sp.]|nr:hypothetical protein [Fimbriimonas sp.]